MESGNADLSRDDITELTENNDKDQKDTVLVDKSSEEEQWSIARSYRDAPEIDNYVKIDEYIPEGQFIDVEYIQAFEYDLLAKRI